MFENLVIFFWAYGPLNTVKLSNIFYFKSQEHLSLYCDFSKKTHLDHSTQLYFPICLIFLLRYFQIVTMYTYMHANYWRSKVLVKWLKFRLRIATVPCVDEFLYKRYRLTQASVMVLNPAVFFCL